MVTTRGNGMYTVPERYRGYLRKPWRERLPNVQRLFNVRADEERIARYIDSVKNQGLPEWVDDAEQPFLIPDPQVLSPSYAEATVISWSFLTRRRNTRNLSEGEIIAPRMQLVDESCQRQLEAEWRIQLPGIPTATAHERLREQVGQVWPVFVHTGDRFQKSLYEGYPDCTENEWLLGPYEVICILRAVGSVRLAECHDLNITAPGAMHWGGNRKQFRQVLDFWVSDDGPLNMNAVQFDKVPSGRSGAASAFLPAA